MTQRGEKTNQRFERLFAEMRLHVSTLMGQLEEASDKADLLANLFVQVERLHSRLHFGEVVEAIHETMVNLVGSEDFALLVHDEDDHYRMLSSMGPGSASLGELTLGEGPMGAAVATGKIVYGDPVAVVPLASGLQPGSVGVIVVMSLLPHKPELVARDRVLLEVLGAHAGVALEAALCAANAQAARLPRMRELLASSMRDLGAMVGR